MIIGVMLVAESLALRDALLYCPACNKIIDLVLVKDICICSSVN